MKDYFIYAGRLDELKGIKVLFQAWKLMGADAHSLIVCGLGPMEEWCRRFIEENSLKSIEMLGFVSNNEIKRLISGAKALILPTQWYEGFPMSVVEAFLVDTPVIGSNIGNVGSIIKETSAGIEFQYDSSESLVKAVKTLLENPIDISVFDLSKYQCDKNYYALMEIYNDLVV